MIDALLGGLTGVLIAVAYIVGRTQGASDSSVLVNMLHAEQARADRLMDRIQEPDIERRQAVTQPVEEGPVPDWMYDDTGLVRVEAESDDSE